MGDNTTNIKDLAIAGGVIIGIVVLTGGIDLLKGLLNGLGQLGAGVVDYIQTMARYPEVATRAGAGVADLLTGGAEAIGEATQNQIAKSNEELQKAIAQGNDVGVMTETGSIIGAVIGAELGTVLQATGVSMEGEQIVEPIAEAFGAGLGATTAIGQALGRPTSFAELGDYWTNRLRHGWSFSYSTGTHYWRLDTSQVYFDDLNPNGIQLIEKNGLYYFPWELGIGTQPTPTPSPQETQDLRIAYRDPRVIVT